MRLRSLLACLVLLGAAPAAASIARALSVEELAERADAVVLGTVTGQAAHWTRDHKQIFTWVAVHVEARWVDQVGAPDTLTVLRPGGELDGLGQDIPGEPRFQVGERVVLFLQRRNHVYRVLGLSQGLFRVEGATAVQELGNLALARPGPTGQLAIGEQGEGGAPPLALEALRRRVLAARGAAVAK